MSGSGSNKDNEKGMSRLFLTFIGNFDTRSPESELDAFLSFGSDASLLQEKQDKASIVELRNGKVVFKQKPISFEKQSDTLQGEFTIMDIRVALKSFLQKSSNSDKCWKIVLTSNLPL